MSKGGVYKDPKSRFQVSCPKSDSVVSKGKYGVSFIYMEGIDNYSVFAYDPEGITEYQFTLETILIGIKNMLRSQKIEINVEREEYGEYRGYQVLDFDFMIPKKGSQSARVYVSRLVKTENYIYWIYYSNASIWGNNPTLETRHFQEAERFFNGIKFENEKI
jgi:hypothetical protein